MSERVCLARSGIRTSRLAFGTSRLHHIGRRERQHLLGVAADSGILHFDTAPAYGDGLAEAELGRYLRGGRDRFVVATKYGIPPDPMIEAQPWLGLPLRGLRFFARSIGLQRDSGGLPPLTASGLRESVAASLRRLATEYIDILLLHEPTVGRIARPDELLEEAVRLKQSGVVRAFGVAGAWRNIGALLAAQPALAEVVQTDEGGWPADCPPDIAYGAIAGGAQTFRGPAIDAATAVQRVREALLRRPGGVVLLSTTKPDHLRMIVQAAGLP